MLHYGRLCTPFLKHAKHKKSITNKMNPCSHTSKNKTLHRHFLKLRILTQKITLSLCQAIVSISLGFNWFNVFECNKPNLNRLDWYTYVTLYTQILATIKDYGTLRTDSGGLMRNAVCFNTLPILMLIFVSVRAWRGHTETVIKGTESDPPFKRNSFWHYKSLIKIHN